MVGHQAIGPNRYRRLRHLFGKKVAINLLVTAFMPPVSFPATERVRSGPMKKTSILIQGWRGINHSYAVINQYQMLELLKRDGLTLYHQDLPFFRPYWNRNDNRHGFAPEDAAKLDAVPPPPEGMVTDIVYRNAYPFRFYGADSRKILCFATLENETVTASDIYSGPEATGQYTNNDFEIVTSSHWSKLEIVNSGYRNETVHVVPLGVDPAVFSPAQRTTSRNEPLGTPGGASRTSGTTSYPSLRRYK